MRRKRFSTVVRPIRRDGNVLEQLKHLLFRNKIIPLQTAPIND